MSYNAKAIANYFIDIAKPTDGLSPMKLQKLVYYAHGWYLAMTGKPLINEQVEAWNYGPVIRSLYNAFRRCGYDRIREKAAIHHIDSAGRVATRIPDISDHPDEYTNTKAVLDRIWEVYGQYTAEQLSNMTHEPGTPWETVRNRYDKLPLGTDIPGDLICDYFRDRLSPSGARAS